MTSYAPAGAPSPFWAPHVHADKRPFLRARAAIAAACRAYFAAEDFMEVEAPCLQVSPGNEAHLAAFATRLIGEDGVASALYLQTSPEFTCKKLLAAGETRIFSFARAFRNRERSALHHPEFTMLEFYRANAQLSAIMDDCAALLQAAARAAGAEVLWRGRAARLDAAPEFLSVAQAFSRYAGVDLLAQLADPKAPDRALLAQDCARLGLRVAEDDSWSDLFSKILSDKVEPHLGLGQPTFLVDYPACEAALARVNASDRRVCERFELYVCGVELANGFGELTDAAEQRARFEEAMALRRARWGEDYPIDEDFLSALAHMPQASGVAVGFDRLVMLAAGAQRIEQVLWAPVALKGAR
jgi:lysyl-tRNA synthetase class 2